MKNILEKLKFNKSLLISFLFIILLLVAIIVLLCTTVPVNNYNELNEKLSRKQKLYTDLVTKNNETEEKNREQEAKIKELSQSEKQEELNNTIKGLEGKVEALTTEKQTLETEIENLKGDVIKIKGEPKTYPAGHLTAGTDVPIGKYKIYGGNSNFVVYSAYGSLQVNIILGSSYGVDEYIYTFKNGDKIEASSSFKLVEVE